MSDLAKKKCVPCEGDIPAFDKSEIHKYLKKVDGWDVKADDQKVYYLIKEFKFKNIDTLMCAPLLNAYARAKKEVDAIAYPANSVEPSNIIPVHLVIICAMIINSIKHILVAAIIPE